MQVGNSMLGAHEALVYLTVDDVPNGLSGDELGLLLRGAAS